jgi:hypothetical protein
MGRRKAQGFDGRRPKLRAQRAHLGDGVVNQARHAVDARQAVGRHAVAARQLRGQPAQIEFQGGETLAQFIVQLTSDVRAFLFDGGIEMAHIGAQLLAGAGEFGGGRGSLRLGIACGGSRHGRSILCHAREVWNGFAAIRDAPSCSGRRRRALRQRCAQIAIALPHREYDRATE